MIIGQFTYDAAADTYNGAIRTMTIRFGNVRIKPFDPYAPYALFDYCVGIQTAHGFVALGRAIPTTHANGTSCLDVVLDDPALAEPIKAQLIRMTNGTSATLSWERPKPPAKRRGFGS